MDLARHSSAPRLPLRHPRRGAGDGFTLLEVMIALAILAVSLVAIAGINASAIDMHAYAKRLTVATMLARSKMADLESKLMSEDLPADDTAEEGTFEEDGFPEYHWVAEIIRPKTENMTPADLMAMAGIDDGSGSSSASGSSASGSGPTGLLGSLLGSASPAGGDSSQGQAAMLASAASGGAGLLGGAMTGQLQTMIDMLGKSVREVHLTVSWQTGKVVDQFTVVTHIVSFGANTASGISDAAANSTALQNAAKNLGNNLQGAGGGKFPNLNLGGNPLDKLFQKNLGGGRK